MFAGSNTWRTMNKASTTPTETIGEISEDFAANDSSVSGMKRKRFEEGVLQGEDTDRFDLQG